MSRPRSPRDSGLDFDARRGRLARILAVVFEVDVQRKLPKRRFLALAAMMALFVMTVVAVAILRPTLLGSFLTLALEATIFGAVALAYAFRSLKGARFESGRLSLESNGELRLAGRRLARREELRQGLVMPTSDGVFVRLERGRVLPDLVLRMPDEAAGRSLLRALGFDAENVAAVIHASSGALNMSPLRQTFLFCVPLFGLAVVAVASVLDRLDRTHIGLGRDALGFYIPAMLAYLMVILRPTTVRVGNDGIFTRWFLSERFIPFADVESVASFDEARAAGLARQRGVRIRLRNGEEVKLITGQYEMSLTNAMLLERRIEEARAARQVGANAVGGALDVALDRGARTFVEWVRELRRIGGGAHDLRSAAVPLDILLQRVENSRAPASERVSAAVAAMSGADPDVKRRIRVAAETSVSPKLRVALEQIAEADVYDEDALVATLERYRAS